MRQLDVTDDQHAYLERVRATLESEYLGPYGQVDILDALQYLIDVHEATNPEMPATDASVVDAATGDDRPATGRAPAEETEAEDARPAVEADPSATEDLAVDVTDDGVEATPDAAGVADDADSEATGEADSADAVTESEDAGGTDADPADAVEDGANEPDGDVDARNGDKSGETDADGTADGSGTEDAGEATEDHASPTPTGGGNDRLQAMMNLLDTHGDKWREGDGEARYEVDLPDGSVESVQTRDDVRAVLFKNYR